MALVAEHPHNKHGNSVFFVRDGRKGNSISVCEEDNVKFIAVELPGVVVHSVYKPPAEQFLFPLLGNRNMPHIVIGNFFLFFKGGSPWTLFKYINRQNNHERSSSYMDILVSRTLYVLSGRTGNRTWAVRSESERSPHWANVASTTHSGDTPQLTTTEKRLNQTTYHSYTMRSCCNHSTVLYGRKGTTLTSYLHRQTFQTCVRSLFSIQPPHTTPPYRCQCKPSNCCTTYHIQKMLQPEESGLGWIFSGPW